MACAKIPYNMFDYARAMPSRGPILAVRPCRAVWSHLVTFAETCRATKANAQNSIWAEAIVSPAL